MENKVVIMRGIPGSGKSTYVLENYPKAIVCSADHYHITGDGLYNWTPERSEVAHELSRHKCRLSMRAKEPLIVIDCTNTQLCEFQRYLYYAEWYGYEVEVVHMMSGGPVISWRRNVHDVPLEVIEEMIDRWEPFEGETIIPYEPRYGSSW